MKSFKLRKEIKNMHVARFFNKFKQFYFNFHHLLLTILNMFPS